MTEIASEASSRNTTRWCCKPIAVSANGLQFLANYTLSKAMDTCQTSQTFTANNVPFNVFDPERSAADRISTGVINS